MNTAPNLGRVFGCLKVALCLALLVFQSATARCGIAEEIDSARTLFLSGDWAEAIDSLARLKPQDSADVAAVCFALGEFHLHDQRLRQAQSCLEQALALKGSESEFHRALGETYAAQAVHAGLLAKKGLANKMTDHLQQAIRLNPKNLRARRLMIQFYLHAPAIVGGSTSAADRECKEIERLDPRLGMRARLNILAEKSRQSALKALESAPPEIRSDPGVLCEWADICGNHRDFARAFEAVDAVLRADPANPRGLYYLGRTAALSGRRLPEGAEALTRYLRTAISLDDPPMVWAHYRLAMIYTRADKIDAARQHFAEALKRSPGHPEISKAAAALPRTRKLPQ